MDEPTQHSGNRDGESNGLRLFIGPAEDVHRRVRFGFEQAFHRGQLGRLMLGHAHRLKVARAELGERADRAEHQAACERTFGEFDVAILEQVPRGDAHHEERAEDERAEPDVDQAIHARRVEDHRPEVDDLGPRETFGR